MKRATQQKKGRPGERMKEKGNNTKRNKSRRYHRYQNGEHYQKMEAETSMINTQRGIRKNQGRRETRSQEDRQRPEHEETSRRDAETLIMSGGGASGRGHKGGQQLHGRKEVEENLKPRQQERRGQDQTEGYKIKKIGAKGGA